MHRLLTFILISFLSIDACAQLRTQTPAEFLGYELGARFTPHYRMLDYFRHVQQTSSNVQLNTYGETNEHRSLVYAIVASPDNLKNLESIRTDNLKRAGALDGTPSSLKTAIVWLSYNVHGDEANSMEASMKTLYELVNPENKKTREWLRNTVVIIDPCVNPDGHERYVNLYTQNQNFPPNADPQSKEHHDSWPGGRFNHYLFDLNRDLAWVTQVETIGRIKIYNQWLPHVHVDFHEQSPNAPYYFAPAAEPYHEIISPWQREFQITIGKNNAKYFDEQGWLYFTKEIFDLYYPGYGDTYPMYSGSIGMTYEKAGGGAAGLVYTTTIGDPLTLEERLTHHFTTGMSTVEISSLNAARLVDEFEKYNTETRTAPAYEYKSYVITGGNNKDKLSGIKSWMNTQGIVYGNPSTPRVLKGFDFRSQSTTSFNMTTDDIVVNVYQPKGRFINAVFEPHAKLTDSLTYDITAWNLIYARDLQAYAVAEKILASKSVDLVPPAEKLGTDKPYSYIFKYHSVADAEFLASLLTLGIKIRAAEKSFTLNGVTFDPGSLIVTRRNNESVPGFDEVIRTTAKKSGRELFSSATGFVEKGADFGSHEVNYLKAPKVALLAGDQTSPQSIGEVWHFFEQQLHYPASVIGTDYFSSIDLWKYTVLVVPEGRYKMWDDSTIEMVNRWIKDGGRLILIGSSMKSFADKKGFELKEYLTEEKKKAAEKEEKISKEKDGLVKYDEAERRKISSTITGAIYKVVLDKSHPLAFGLTNYYTLKNSESHYDLLENAWNVGTLSAASKPVMGYAGYKINKSMANTLVMGVEDIGKGEVVYFVDDPLFRSFWENGKLLFANAVFMVGQ